jgi:hypothetical protein
VKKFLIITGIIFLSLVGSNAYALDYHFDGNFEFDNDVVMFDFTITQPQTIIIFSSSWGDDGDKMGDTGNLSEDSDGYVSNGGLDPVLEIWEADGAFIEGQDDGEDTGTVETSRGNLTDSKISELEADGKVVVDGDTLEWTYGYFDSFWEIDLGTGSYTASVAQFNNFSNANIASTGNISQGFRWNGIDNRNFTQTEGFGGGGQDFFNGVYNGNDPDPRTSYWAFHILNVDEAVGPGSDPDPGPDPVPEPGTMFLMGLGLLGLAGVSRKRINH